MDWKTSLECFLNSRNSDIADLISSRQVFANFEKVNRESESYFHASNHSVTAGVPFTKY